MEIINTGRKFMLVVEYKELINGFAIKRHEEMILDASQIEVTGNDLVVRRKGRGRGTAEHFAGTMVTELRELRM